eukprot:TRINITY_DN35505_c0_g1_i3.p1 TRINITY_DN35505_c0_g1~~TRINITY_DN35505_c0_g1_i3.p1  ORF type:complete len:532 (+),score=97.54 TRINITY_DN35505_c0_g1_i3:29-1597(+)
MAQLEMGEGQELSDPDHLSRNQENAEATVVCAQPTEGRAETCLGGDLDPIMDLSQPREVPLLVSDAKPLIARGQPQPKAKSFRADYGTMIVSYPWKQTEEVAAWGERSRSLLERLKAPPPASLEQAELAADVDTSGVRLISATEIVQQMIEHRLHKEGLLDSDESCNEEGDEEALPAAKKRKVSRTLPAKRMKKLKIGSKDIEREAPILEYKEVLAERWLRCCSETAKLLQDPPRSQDWHVANKSSGKNTCAMQVFENCVRGSPLKRWLHRIKARYTGRHVIDKASDRECTPPEIQAVPAEVARVASDEVIVTVCVCTTDGSKEQEYEMLASQTLYELRDAFYFVGDWMFDGPTRLGSACMFIDGAFYSDMRHETSIDYSKELIESIKVTGCCALKEEPARTMDVSLRNLGRIPFGEKCCYIRQGDMEHFMYFTGARTFDANNDCPFMEAYPCLTFMREYRKRKCIACLQNNAVWVVQDSSRCPENPGFWCQECFRHFFQDKDGEYITPVDYKVFPYLHDDT